MLTDRHGIAILGAATKKRPAAQKAQAKKCARRRPEVQLAASRPIDPAATRAVAAAGILLDLDIPENDLYSLQDGCCFFCHGRMEPWRNVGGRRGWTRDHLFPRSHKNPQTGNLVLAHTQCNSRKSDRPPTADEVARLRRIQDRYLARNGQVTANPFFKDCWMKVSHIDPAAVLQYRAMTGARYPDTKITKQLIRDSREGIEALPLLRNNWDQSTRPGRFLLCGRFVLTIEDQVVTALCNYRHNDWKLVRVDNWN